MCTLSDTEKERGINTAMCYAAVSTIPTCCIASIISSIPCFIVIKIIGEDKTDTILLSIGLPLNCIIVIIVWYIISPTSTKTLIYGILILIGGSICLALGIASVPFVILGGLLYIVYLFYKCKCRCCGSCYSSSDDDKTPIQIIIPPSSVDSCPISTYTPPHLDENTIIFESTNDYLQDL